MDKTPSTDKKRVILVGLDGATFDLFGPWMEKGYLPHMKRIREEGVWGTLDSTIPCTTPVAWSAVFTGKNPGKHGIFDFRESFHFDAKRPLISCKSIRAARIWHILNREGKITNVMNVPMTFPPEKLEGFMIGGMMTPSEESDFTYPSELKRELLSKFPNYRVDIDIPKYDPTFIEDCFVFLDDIKNSFMTRRDAFFHLMDSKPWDFFFTVFILSDRIQHVLWKYFDPNWPDFYNSKKGKRLWDRILQCYQLQDEMLGMLLDKLDDNTYLFINSDHGFGGTEAYINVNTLLEEWGLLKTTKSESLQKRLFFKAWEFGDTPFAKKVIPKGIQRAVRNRIRQTRSSFKSEIEAQIDYTTSKALFASIPAQGVFINVKREDGSGVVEPGKEYDGLRAFIKEKLYTVEDPDTGEKVMDKVFYREELYHGPSTKYAPDVVFIAKNYAFLGRQHIGSPKPVTSWRDQPTGFHRPNGIFMAYGRNIKKGFQLPKAEMWDLAPTILYSFGLGVPEDMDGRPLLGCFQPDHVAANPVKKVDASKYEGIYEEVYSEEETEAIKERLKGLGYIE